MLKHFLYSNDLDTNIKTYESFDKDIILNDIITHLTNYPNDTIEHQKEFSAADKKKYAGNNIINFYEVNPKNNKPSLIVIKGSKEYFKSLS